MERVTTLEELNLAMAYLVRDELNLVIAPVRGPLPEYVKPKLQYYEHELGEELIDFLCGALVVSMVSNAKLQYNYKENTQTLCLQPPTIVQVSPGKHRVTALFLNLPQIEMSELLHTIKASVEAQNELLATPSRVAQVSP